MTLQVVLSRALEPDDDVIAQSVTRPSVLIVSRTEVEPNGLLAVGGRGQLEAGPHAQ